MSRLRSPAKHGLQACSMRGPKALPMQTQLTAHSLNDCNPQRGHSEQESA